MAKTQQTDAVWHQIDPETLNGDVALFYNEYKAQYKAAKATRQHFEDEMNALADLPEGKRLVFGYNFGKLSVAVVDAGPAKSKGKPVASLATYLANMR